MPSTTLYHRINQLVEENQNLKIAAERSRTRARLAEDVSKRAGELNGRLLAENTRLCNENSSLKHTLSAASVVGFRRGGTLACGGTVAE